MLQIQKGPFNNEHYLNNFSPLTKTFQFTERQTLSKHLTKVLKRTSNPHFIFFIRLNHKATSFAGIAANTWGTEGCVPRTMVEFTFSVFSFDSSVANLSNRFFIVQNDQLSK